MLRDLLLLLLLLQPPKKKKIPLEKICGSRLSHDPDKVVTGSSSALEIGLLQLLHTTPHHSDMATIQSDSVLKGSSESETLMTPGRVAALNNRGGLLFFEDFDFRDKQEWMSRNWTYSYGIIGLYFLAIIVGKRLMRDRKEFDLRRALTSWNVGLALFSIAATLRTVPELINILLQENGFHSSVCYPCEDVSPTSAFWAWAFVLSKVVELGDTAFIVLRKQPLIFLHWYHHMTVLLYSWYSYADYISPARWFVVMNYLVHSVMYSYYALKSLKVRIPRGVAMCITCLQLSQMVVGLYVNLYAYSTKNGGGFCDVPYQQLNMGLTMYASYFALFINFFYRAYFQRKAANKARKDAAAAKNNNNKIKTN